MITINKISNWYFSKSALPYWCILLADCAIVMAAGYVCYYLEIGGLEFAQNFWAMTHTLIIITFVYAICFKLFHTYLGVIRYSSFVDLERIMLANGTASIILLALIFFYKTNFTTYDNLMRYITIPIIFALSTMAMCASRVLVKALFDTMYDEGTTQRVFIYGVRAGGYGIARAIMNEQPRRFTVAGFVSPRGDFTHKYLMSVKVYRDNENLVHHIKQTRTRILIISPLEHDHFRNQTALIQSLNDAGIKIFKLNLAEEWDGQSEFDDNNLTEVQIEDLLPRDQINVDMYAIGSMLAGKRILITGAAGSIGSEMVRQIATFNPAELTLIDQAETPMHDIRRMMARQFPNIKSHTIVASISNECFMEKIFDSHRPEYVFHAAAYKHVPMMEDNPAMAVQNNIAGTRIIADLAVKYGTKKFVMISTDKAVNPTNVMGCSKRICEIYCQSLSKAIKDGEVQGTTQFVTTRFGNVLGSNGSVIPIFREQIKQGGPITVTHPDIIRYFMLIPEACKLVLEAGTMGKGGEIFVFDMGKPVRIVDLAKRMISLSGAKNVEIVFTGLRDGEKLYEEVLSDKEKTIPTNHPKIMVAKVREYDYKTACESEERLLQASYSYDDMEIVRIMKEIVPEFKSQESKYCALD